MKFFFLLLILPLSGAWARFTEKDLALLVEESQKKDSDVLIVWKDGKILHHFNRHPEKLYSIQSITKSLVSLTTACLTRENEEELDASPVFTEWKDTDKATITLRMLLQMTSGIQDGDHFWGNRDLYKTSSELPLITTPGYAFSYANASTMLVGKWIKKKTGTAFSQQLKKCFLDPMGIKKWTMTKDSAGNEQTSGGLHLLADDLLKFGLLLIQKGSYEGKELLNRDQIAGIRNDWLRDDWGYGQGFWTWGRKITYGEGYLGQWLFIVPKENLVIVRLRNPPGMQWSEENELNWFHDLPSWVYSLI